MKHYSLAHLQRVQPWTIPYTSEFEVSVSINELRYVQHDIMHVLKGLGRIAADCERADHGTDEQLTAQQWASNLSDLVVCALHIASVMGIDLEGAVIDSMEQRNGVAIPDEGVAE